MPNIRAILPMSAASEHARIFIDERDITNYVQGITIRSHVTEVTKVHVELIPKDIVYVDEAMTEMIIYEGVNGERLIPLADALNVWHCGCSTWNAMSIPECRVCQRPRPEQAFASMEFEIAFRFDVSVHEPNIGDIAMERIKALARAMPPELWSSFRVFMCNRTHDAEERKRACAPPDLTTSSNPPPPPYLPFDTPETPSETSSEASSPVPLKNPPVPLVGSADGSTTD
jgi:hypothetical protein